MGIPIKSPITFNNPTPFLFTNGFNMGLYFIIADLRLRKAKNYLDRVKTIYKNGVDSAALMEYLLALLEDNQRACQAIVNADQRIASFALMNMLSQCNDDDNELLNPSVSFFAKFNQQLSMIDANHLPPNIFKRFIQCNTKYCNMQYVLIYIYTQYYLYKNIQKQ